MLVRIGKAARIIGVSVATLRRWETTGDLMPAEKTSGGTRYYRMEDLQRFADSTEFKLHEVPTRALLFELLRRVATTEQANTSV